MGQESFWGRGWSFPPTFQRTNLEVSLVVGEQCINQSINLILSTEKGERSLHPGFGSSLRAFLFGAADSTLRGELAAAVSRCLLSCEPRIRVDSVKVSTESSTPSTVLVNIVYTIKSTNSRHNHVYPFVINEGHNVDQGR